MTGGHRLQGLFFEPTVIVDATSNMQCAREETFGPLAPVFRFRTDEEAILVANDTEFGLASYFYSRDIGRIYRVAEALEYGMVGINVGIRVALSDPRLIKRFTDMGVIIPNTDRLQPETPTLKSIVGPCHQSCRRQD